MKKLTNTSDFKSEVLENNGPAIVNFGRTTCGQCKMMERLYESIESEYEGKVSFFKANLDDNDLMTLAEEYKINQLPTFILFQDGAPSARMVGAGTKVKLQGLLAGI